MPGKSINQSDDEGMRDLDATDPVLKRVSLPREESSPDGSQEAETRATFQPPDAFSLTAQTPAGEPVVKGIIETSRAQGAGVVPLGIDPIDALSDEDIVGGWPGAVLEPDEPVGDLAFPLHMPASQNILLSKPGVTDWSAQGPGAVELVPQEPFPGVQESQSKQDELALDEPESVQSNGNVELTAQSATASQEEVIGAVELTPNAPHVQQQPAEIIGPIELAHFFAESNADPASIVEQTPTAVIETAVPQAQVAERRHLVKSAALVSIGNLGSSLLGMVRQIVVTSQGVPIATPFNAALAPVNNFYQLLVNGSTDGALIPVFNDYAAPERRHEMRRVVFTVVNLIFIIALVASIGYLVISPWFVDALVSGYPGANKALTLQYSQIIFFSLIVLGPFAVLLAALFSLKSFGWPAFATASYHAGIILGAFAFMVFGTQVWGPLMLPIGLLIGAAGQIVLLLPGIRDHKVYYMFVLDLKHPALKRIYRLYWPIAISYVFSMAQVFLDLHLQSLTPQHAAATTAMATATTLIQFPIGIVAQALSVAVLPTLAEHAREGNMDRFKEALLLGIRLGLLLMIPAMTGLLILRTPIVYAIFAHRHYSLADANLSALALQNYAYQLPFVALDQLLIAAFYARKNTKTPVIIGVVSMLFYLAVALPFYSNIGVAALAFANTVQNSSHAIILLILLRMSIGSLHIRRTIPSIVKICVAALAMGLVAWGALFLLGHVSLFSLNHLIGQLLTLIVAGGLAVAVYLGAILLFKVEEINLVKRAVLAKLGKK